MKVWALFNDWLPLYVAFKDKSARTLGQPVPDEISELKHEHQNLEPMLFQAREFSAEAIYYYYEAKALKAGKLNFKEVAPSAIDGMAKAASYKELWARESAAGLVEVIVSRGFKVGQALKMMGQPL